MLLVSFVLGARSLQPSAPATAPTRVSKNIKLKPRWRHDLSLAQAEAGVDQRYILLNFTGSDWCGWCLRLRRELFAKPEFLAYAETNLVLVEIDFPRENDQSAQQRAANAAAALDYGVNRVPAIVLLDWRGHTLRKWGFEDGGARHYLAEFRKAIADFHSEPTFPEVQAVRAFGAVHE